MDSLALLNKTIINCKKCPRLVKWRRTVAEIPPRRYQSENYWSRPLPGFGDPTAKLLVVGLAPAAHGGNRTGRMFTGDRSGEWLFETLHRFGFANQSRSYNNDDGLKLKNCYITAAVRCAPPANKPSREEFGMCRPYLLQELKLFNHLRVVVALGKVGFDTFLRAYRENGGVVPKPSPQFYHGASTILPGSLTLLASYHPSQLNTFTGKLTRRSFHSVFRQAFDTLYR